MLWEYAGAEADETVDDGVLGAPEGGCDIGERSAGAVHGHEGRFVLRPPGPGSGFRHVEPQGLELVLDGVGRSAQLPGHVGLPDAFGGHPAEFIGFVFRPGFVEPGVVFFQLSVLLGREEKGSHKRLFYRAEGRGRPIPRDACKLRKAIRVRKNETEKTGKPPHGTLEAVLAFENFNKKPQIMRKNCYL